MTVHNAGFTIVPIGRVESNLKARREAPKQGAEGAPDAWLVLDETLVPGLEGLTVGDNMIVVTWLHEGRRDVLKVHPRDDRNNPVVGVFATRSPNRPNPLGFHRVTVHRMEENRLLVGPMDAIDGTPVVDLKPVLSGIADF